MKRGWVAVIAAIVTMSWGTLAASTAAGQARQVEPTRLSESATARGHMEEAVAADSLAPAPLRLKILPGTVSNAKRLGPNPDLSGLRRWHAYAGVVPISEKEFYRILGQGSLHAAAEAARKRRMIAISAGAVSMVVGTLLFTSRPPTGPDRPAISPRHLVGGFMIPIGGFTVGISVMTADRRRVALGIAQEMAESYNLR